ncbi:MAG: DUF2911 domain-containing protein [Candidatus Pseudobacter hemicellulosilyticus]|uniref:DUF2911 domain-containing protein n=1 Tax=Candidatus Pseudobacter hemicellulosilyticus TaxID=3121375 RepID=A0AAJ6BK72_9BACT|nr:MAG: DUF2911 domain-containing protein [Pseudobacter sp.]
MKKLLFLSTIVLAGLLANAQEDKSKRPSPPATVSETTDNGVKITIDYSQPALKGRKVGGEVAPYGQVWRTGANEATTFEVDKAVKVEGKELPAGKYGLFTIPNQEEWVIIFNKTPKQWGAYKYAEADDVLRVTVKAGQAPQTVERLTFTIAKTGKVTLLWGETAVEFTVE